MSIKKEQERQKKLKSSSGKKTSNRAEVVAKSMSKNYQINAAQPKSGDGGSGTTDVMDGASSAAIASGNPYAVAGGLALSAYSSGKKRKRQEAEAEAKAKYNAKKDKLKRTQNAYTNLSQTYANMRL